MTDGETEAPDRVVVRTLPSVASDRKCKPNCFIKRETCYLSIVLVSGMTRFWTQFNETPFLWCLGNIFNCVPFLLRLLVARGV